MFNYYYGNEAEQYTFFRIPKALFTDEKFKHLSCDAKMLYGLLLDRMSLSVKNKWLDENNRVYIYFTLEDVQEQMNCGRDKGMKLFGELDSNGGVGLIERKKQGLGKPTIIYVKNFISNTNLQTTEKPTSGPLNILSAEVGKSDSNKTDDNNTNMSDTETSIHPSKAADRIDERETYRKLILKNIEFDVIKSRYDENMLTEIVDIMTDTVCSNRKSHYITGDEIPKEVVKSRLLKLDSTHIEYVFECIQKNTTKIRNIKSYLLTCLYNVVTTISHYYTAEVSHDLYGTRC